MEPKICRREVRAASGPVHHLTPSPTSHDSVTKRFAHIQPGFGPHKYPEVSFPLETDAGAQTIPCEALHKPL